MQKIIPYIVISLLLASCSGIPGEFTEKDSRPPLVPDLSGITIPVNLAPLNFRFADPSGRLVVLFNGRNSGFSVKGRGKIIIPPGKWKKLLEGSLNDSIAITLFSRQNNQWVKYRPFYVHVKSPIDQYLVYRLIAPGYESWSEMGIYQRDLTSYRQDPVIDNRLLTGNCMNCHSFNRNDPGQMMFHLRGNIGATMLVKDGNVTKLDTKTKETLSNCVYPYWHPTGAYIAYSVNLISQVFHTTPGKRIEVMDSKSDLVVYDINSNKLLTSGLISGESSFETFPSFSPDGRYLYFCSAQARPMPEEYDNVRYSLCRIAFDPESGTFGRSVDTLVCAEKTGKSVSFPRPSHDGRFLMFTLSDYGNFSIWHREADLFLLDLSTGSFREIGEANSEDTESYHSWSSGSRWFVFSSRRMDGLYTRPYIAWIDESGKSTKPFPVPQKDPYFYDNSLLSFNVPELVSGRVKVDGRDMTEEILSPGKKVLFEIK